ncbi:MAG: hypothetical protein U9Q72_00075 [Patescibacteria group bacterium]|nr:hypothetical protein [Patescibacteria group bacterium]
MKRKTKQIIITSIYLAVAIGSCYLVYKVFFGPSCHDGRQNGMEKGIDCGGSCPQQCLNGPELKNLQLGSVSVIEYKERFDVALEVTNINGQFGFGEVAYEVALYSGEEKVGRREGKIYLLPNETRYLIETGIECQAFPDKAKVYIQSGEWQEFTKEERPKLEILNKSFGYKKVAGNFFEVNLQVANRSSYDFLTVDIDAVVKDKSGKVLAVSKANLNSVKSGEVRDFRFFWPEAFEGQAQLVEIKAQSNVFDLKNLYSK